MEEALPKRGQVEDVLFCGAFRRPDTEGGQIRPGRGLRGRDTGPSSEVAEGHSIPRRSRDAGPAADQPDNGAGQEDQRLQSLDRDDITGAPAGYLPVYPGTGGTLQGFLHGSRAR